MKLQSIQCHLAQWEANTWVGRGVHPPGRCWRLPLFGGRSDPNADGLFTTRAKPLRLRVIQAPKALLQGAG